MQTSPYVWNQADTCLEASSGWQLIVLNWARANGFYWDGRTCSNAAACGHLDVLQWAHASGCE